jgi:hypothetical protein
MYFRYYYWRKRCDNKHGNNHIERMVAQQTDQVATLGKQTFIPPLYDRHDQSELTIGNFSQLGCRHVHPGCEHKYHRCMHACVHKLMFQSCTVFSRASSTRTTIPPLTSRRSFPENGISAGAVHMVSKICSSDA